MPSDSSHAAPPPPYSPQDPLPRPHTPPYHQQSDGTGSTLNALDRLGDELQEFSVRLRTDGEEHPAALRHLGDLMSQQEEELASQKEENADLRRWLAAANARIEMHEEESAAERHRSAEEIGRLQGRLAAAEARIEANKKQAKAKDLELASLRDEVVQLQRKASAPPAVEAQLPSMRDKLRRPATEQTSVTGNAERAGRRAKDDLTRRMANLASGQAELTRRKADLAGMDAGHARTSVKLELGAGTGKLSVTVGTPGHSSGWSYSMDLPSSSNGRRSAYSSPIPPRQATTPDRFPSVQINVTARPPSSQPTSPTLTFSLSQSSSRGLYGPRSSKW